MLEDFVVDLLKLLKQKHEMELQKLVACPSSERHDVVRGRVQATEEAMHSIQGLFNSYTRQEAA